MVEQVLELPDAAMKGLDFIGKLCMKRLTHAPHHQVQAGFSGAAECLCLTTGVSGGSWECIPTVLVSFTGPLRDSIWIKLPTAPLVQGMVEATRA